jgi:hypothetical protein
MLCLRAAGPSRPPWRKAAHPCRIHLARSALGVGLCFVGFQRPGTFIIGKPDLSPPPPRQFTAVHTRPSCFAPMPICFHPHPICLPCYSALSLPSRVDAPLVFSLPWPASSRARARSQCLNGCNSQSVRQGSEQAGQCARRGQARQWAGRDVMCMVDRVHMDPKQSPKQEVFEVLLGCIRSFLHSTTPD